MDVLYLVIHVQESDMSIQPLRLSGRSQSMGVIVDSLLPHLVCMDDDILSTGVVMYYLKVRYCFIMYLAMYYLKVRYCIIMTLSCTTSRSDTAS